ncbi:putative cysteine desulfurase [Diplonema papillatum]|nr:putative cysteine desulfurase [Diplonema papillatum]
MQRFMIRAPAALLRRAATTLALNSHPGSEEIEKRAVYLDAQATQPMDPRVLDAMLPFFIDQFGNPGSRTHEYGWTSEHAVDKARDQLKDLIGASQTREIIFTSGATESNNIAVKGVARFWQGTKKHIVTLQTEHKCVLESCRALEGEGFEVTFLPVQKDGSVDLEALEAAIRPDTALVSIMAVHNEIGVIQPLKEIGALCRKHKVYFHTDAAQAMGKIPINVDEMNIDLMSISGHKMYGPKGIGALYVRRRPRVRLTSPISGGGQERGIRSGTIPTPLVVGLGAAAEVAKREMANDKEHCDRLASRLWGGLTKVLPHVYINGPPLGSPNRYDGNLNISFDCVEGESLLMGIEKIAVSSGSACTSASLEPSYVLRALGVSEAVAHTSLRFGIGRFTTEAEVDFTIDSAVTAVTRLREMSPLWEAKLEGRDFEVEFA